MLSGLWVGGVPLLCCKTYVSSTDWLCVLFWIGWDLAERYDGSLLVLEAVLAIGEGSRMGRDKTELLLVGGRCGGGFGSNCL